MTFEKLSILLIILNYFIQFVTLAYRKVFALLINWYSKLTMVVRWKGCLSNSFF